MPDLDFSVQSVAPLPYSVSPHLVFKILVTNNDEPEERVQSIMLRCQIQIETVRRQYNGEEKSKLFELYGEPERWGQTLKTLLWTHANVAVQPFSVSAVVDLPVPCTFDFNVAATKFFAGLDQGNIPLCILFSGTVFYHDDSGALQVSQISWEKEANYQLPVGVWKEMMDLYYPNSAWLNIQKDVFERLRDYKMKNSIPNWEQTFERLLNNNEASLIDSLEVASNHGGRSNATS